MAVAGTQVNYFFSVASWATDLIFTSRDPNKFLWAQFFSVDVKEKSKHSNKNEQLFI